MHLSLQIICLFKTSFDWLLIVLLCCFIGCSTAVSVCININLKVILGLTVVDEGHVEGTVILENFANHLILLADKNCIENLSLSLCVLNSAFSCWGRVCVCVCVCVQFTKKKWRSVSIKMPKFVSVTNTITKLSLCWVYIIQYTM